MDPYITALHLHSVLRWLVLLAGLFLVVKSIIGLASNGTYGKLDNIVSASFVGTLHLQLLIGLVLYFFLSPITESALADFGGAMKNAELRFWAVEHLTLMILGIVFAQIGRTKSKKQTEDKKKFESLQVEVVNIKSDVNEIKSMLNSITELLNK